MGRSQGPYDDALLSPHALLEMKRRGITIDALRTVLAAPGREELARPGRVVLSALETRPNGRAYVLRVFVDIDRKPPVVVTAYRSSKIAKYWSSP
ncbi:MAG: DUF4258 domain-containing protein [Dehalococcoidia bacterium]|nr:DUF4258 domain-containing protein [Dehalococcoidia bacterium]